MEKNELKEFLLLPSFIAVIRFGGAGGKRFGDGCGGGCNGGDRLQK